VKWGGSPSHKHDTGPRPYIIHSLYYKLFISYIINYTYYTYFFILYMHIASLLEGNDLFRFQKAIKDDFLKISSAEIFGKEWCNGASKLIAHFYTQIYIYTLSYPILSYPLPCIYSYIHIKLYIHYNLNYSYYTYIYIHTVSVSTNWIHGR